MSAIGPNIYVFFCVQVGDNGGGGGGGGDADADVDVVIPSTPPHIVSNVETMYTCMRRCHNTPTYFL